MSDGGTMGLWTQILLAAVGMFVVLLLFALLVSTVATGMTNLWLGP